MMKKHNLYPQQNLEMRLWIILLVLPNLGLLLGNLPAVNLTFDVSAVGGGEWWRYLTWPWVHVSRYHLLLDGSAFLCLYAGLEERRSLMRLGYLLSSVTGSLLLPLAVSSSIYQIGLCGLSGVAHGLCAISALEMVRHKSQRQAGAILLVGLLIKVGWELYSGQAFLQGLHLGDIGQPIVSTHAGGMLGGGIGYGVLQYIRKFSVIPKNH